MSTFLFITGFAFGGLFVLFSQHDMMKFYKEYLTDALSLPLSSFPLLEEKLITTATFVLLSMYLPLFRVCVETEECR